MKRFVTQVATATALILLVIGGASAQTIYPTPFFTNFHDTLYSSTFNGHLMPKGSIIEAYDPDGVLCGIDTVSMAGAYGFMPVYGDDIANTPALDEGAEAGDLISFKINGRNATVVSGNATWADQAFRNVQLDVSTGNTVIAMTVIDQPGLTLVAPGDTVSMLIRIRNDGNGLDFYGLHVGMTGPEGPNPLTEWETIIPDTLIYADAGETISFAFKLYAPVWPGDTANMVSYKLFSYLDTTVNVEDDVEVYATITDADDPDAPMLPGSFALGQNYPNPFNPVTTIEFALPTGSQVRFDVYDILGQVVESRDLGFLSAGDHRLEFDGTDLASGVYLYRMSTETSAQNKKMILLK